MKLLGSIWRVLTPAQRRAVLLMQGLSLLTALATAVGVASIAPFLALLGAPGLIARQSWLQVLREQTGITSPQAVLTLLGVCFVGLVLLANVLTLLAAFVSNRLAMRIGQELQSELFASYLTRGSLEHLAGHSTARYDTIVSQSTRFTHGVLENLFALVTSVVTAVLILGSMLYLQAGLALLVAGSLAAMYGLLYCVLRQRLRHLGERQTQLARTQARLVAEALAGLREILLSRAQSYFTARFAQLSRGLLSTVATSRLLSSCPRQLIETAAAAGLVSVGLLLTSGPAGSGARWGLLGFLGFATYRLLPTLQQAFGAIARIHLDAGSLEVIGPQLHAARAQDPSIAAPESVSQPPAGRAWQQLQIRGLAYRHASAATLALAGISLRIRAGAMLGIVGSNGAGKTTLLEVLAGLLVPTHGTLELDGTPLDSMHLPAWQIQIAYAAQRPCMLDASLAENIAFGSPPEAIDHRRLEAALRAAQLLAVAPGSEAASCLQVGEHGLRLSAGQRQKVAIARAFYRSASVLLLDEPTHSLDESSSRELIALLRELRGRCTIIVATHDPRLAQICDELLQIDAGRICAAGPTREVMRKTAAASC